MILLSFSLEGASVGDGFARALHSLGHHVIVDQRRVYASDEEVPLLMQNLRRSEVFVSIATSSEITNDPWIFFELGLANALGKKVLLATNSPRVGRECGFLPEAAEIIPCSVDALVSRLGNGCWKSTAQGSTGAPDLMSLSGEYPQRQLRYG